MSCSKNVQRGTLAAVKCGISRRANQVSFFAGVYLGVVINQMISPWRIWRQRPQTTKSAANPLPILPGIEQVKPLAANELTSGRCAHCQNLVAESPGGDWYHIKTGQYCPNCAPAKAQIENIALLPTRTTSSSQAKPTRFTSRLTTLQPKPVFSVSGGSDIQGYAVRCLGRDTGLLLAPDVTRQAGQVTANPGRWFIIYEQAGEPVGGPFANVKQAQAMASLLVNVDWTRTPDQFSSTEVHQANAMARQMRGDLGYNQAQTKQLDGLWS